MTERCDSCGRFSAGPFIVDDWEGDSSEPSMLTTALIGPCCQSEAERQ